MLYEKLLRYRKNKLLVGFCKWKDGKGLLFGRVLDADRTEARFELVHPDGTFDEVLTVLLGDITRLESSPAYVKRLTLFAKLRIPKGKGQATTARATIARRLRLAHRTGECVSLTRKNDTKHDYRVIAIERELVELFEYGDDPTVIVDTLMLHLDQIESLEWRGAGENAVTQVWRRGGKPRGGAR